MSATRDGSQAAPRRVTEVAVGVLLRADDAVLLADRPVGKPYAGYWEFPGGKIEPGESVEHALQRELHEELGIDIGGSTPWVTFEFDYPHAYVRLHFRRIYDWCGTPRGREGQRLAFFRLLDEPPQPLLPAAVPALRWLGLPTLIAEVTLDDADQQLSQLERAFAQGVRMVALRASARSFGFGAVEAFVQEVRIRADAVCGRVVLDDELARIVGAAGPAEHAISLLTDRSTSTLDPRPAASWVGLRTTNRAAIVRAAALGYDFAVIGPVLPKPADAIDAAIGWHGFEALSQHASMPILAAGGLELDDLAFARQAGAHGLLLPVSAWCKHRVIRPVAA